MGLSDKRQILSPLSLASVGIVLQLFLSIVSIGTNDIVTWQEFAQSIRATSLSELYHSDELFNHPPFMGLFALLCEYCVVLLGASFPILFRLPGILCQIFVLFALYEVVRRRSGEGEGSPSMTLAALLVTWNPIVMLVTGFHGNTDPLYIGLAFLGCVSFERKHFVRAGLLLGAAINVKLIPALLVFPLLLSSPNREAGKRFLFGLLPWSLPFIVAYLLTGPPFISNVLGYSANVSNWGISFWLAQLTVALEGAQDPWKYSLLYHEYGRFFILGGVLLLSLVQFRYQRFDPYQVALLTFGIFLVFAPGVGVQYFIVLPFFLSLVNPYWGLVYGLIGGLHLIMTYLDGMVLWWPLYYEYHDWPADVVLIGVLHWMMIVATVMMGMREKSRSRSE